MSGTGVGQIGLSVLSATIALAGMPVPSDPVVPVEAGDAIAAVAADPQDAVPADPRRPPPTDVPVTSPQATPATDALPADAPAETDDQSDVIVQGRSRRGDPLEPFNATTFGATQAVDGAIVGPAALAYEKNVPSPIRSGLRNFLANLREPVVALNYLLQLKPGKAAETAGRFVVNSTVGVAGLVDVAKRKPFRLPLRRNSFANTLGFYGVKQGPFFFLPLLGPTTLRDLTGLVVDQVLVPIQPIRPAGGLAYTLPIGVLSALDYRVQIEPDLQRQRASRDPYAALRRDYLARRQAEIDALKGRRTPPVAPPTTAVTDPVARR